MINLLKSTTLCTQLSLASSEVPSKIEQGVRDAQAATKKIKTLSKTHGKLSQEISDHVVDTKSLQKRLSTINDQIKELEKYSNYLKWIAKLEDQRFVPDINNHIFYKL